MHQGPGRLVTALLVFLFTVTAFSANAQALLPNITVVSRNGKNYLSWRSGYSGVKQIGVQRSQDSLFNYATIGHAANPGKKVNSFVDSRPRPGKNFYRLFVLLSNNSYFFTNPTSLSLVPATLEGPPPNTPQAFSPSIFVYTNADGNVNISLTRAGQKKYSIRFFDGDNHFLFEIADIGKPLLILDKTNFMRAGWYHYELYEDGKIKEKWKFYISDAVEK